MWRLSTEDKWELGVTAAIMLVAMLLVVLCPAVAHANQDIPRAALKHRAELTRSARAVWGLDAPIAALAAQVQQESGWDSAAVSVVGARGMAQFMPATAAWWCGLNGLAAVDCQPANPTWALRALVGYDFWLMQRVRGATEYDRLWAALRAYNGGLGHWQKEAAVVVAATDLHPPHQVVDAACGRARRARQFCAENLGYPKRILEGLQPRYLGWGRVVSPLPLAGEG